VRDIDTRVITSRDYFWPVAALHSMTSFTDETFSFLFIESSVKLIYSHVVGRFKSKSKSSHVVVSRMSNSKSNVSDNEH